MDEHNETPQSSFPTVRIWLCGPFQIEWVNSATGLVLPTADQTMGGRDQAAAIALLSLLLCQPNRQAHRDWIMEQFWPESSQHVAVHRLENILSCLRKLLRPPTGEESLLRSIMGKKSSGTSYCLDAYPKLWVDLDALTGNVEQAARMERFGENALPFWQCAFDLFKRGPFLVDDPYDSYATWVKEQREHLDGYSRQCVHALARLYLANHTEAGKAEAQLVLRTYWQRHKSDEDALRPLLELLGEQERYQEAEQYYQQLLLALIELGPDEEGQPRVPDPRTYDIREYLRTKQIQRKQPQSQSISQERKLSAHLESSIRQIASTTSSLPYMTQKDMLAPSLPCKMGSLQTAPLPGMEGVSQWEENVSSWSMWFGSRLAQLITVVDHWQGQAISCDHLQALLGQEILEFNGMKPQFNDEPYILSRRQALVTIAMLPVALWTSVQQGITSASLTEKLLTRCAASITSLWHLLQGNELSLIEQTLSTYVLTLVTLAQQPSQYQKTAARLTSQVYRLYGIIALHRNNLKARKNYCQQALYFSKMAEDTSLVVSAHISLASTFYYEKNPVKATEIYQQALLQQEILPLQRARLHAELAVVYAQQKREQDALHSLGFAQDLYPDHPETDPSFLYAEFTPTSMILEKGLTHLALSQHFPDRSYEQNAWNSFIQIETLQVENVVPERILFEIVNHQAETAIRLSNMELFQVYVEKGIEGAHRLQSIQRYQEIREVYAHALCLWPHEMCIKHIGDLFH